MRGPRSDQSVDVLDAAARAAVLAAQGVETLLDTSDPLTRYIGMERYVHSVPARHAQVADEYSPINGRVSFPLPVYWIPWGEAVEIGKAHPTGCACPPQTAPVVLHPSTAGDAPAFEPDEVLEGVPTASGRTVLVPSANGLEFLKLNHPGVLGRFPRSFKLAKWLSGLEVWALISGSGFDLSCHVMPEPGGVYLDRRDRPGFGWIRRYDEWLWDRMARGAHLHPFFSLLRDEPDGSPLVFERVADDTGNTPASLCLQITELLVSSYWELAWGLGLIPEFHRQNCLLLVGPDGDDLTLVVRDLTDVRVDVSRREQLGLETVVSCYAAIHRDRSEDYFARRSYAYDRNLGEILVQRLIHTAAGGDERLERELLEEARRLAQRAMPPDDGYFQPPHQMFTYADVDVGPELIDAGRGPFLR
jgi:hypothetical protein